MRKGTFKRERVLSFSYANDSSATYAELIRERDELDKVDQEYRVRVRDLLFTLITIGNVLGYYVGPGKCVYQMTL